MVDVNAEALPFFGASIPGFVGLLTGRGPFSPALALIPGRSVSYVNSLADLWILKGLDAPHVSALCTLVDPGSLIGTLGSKRSSSWRVLYN